MEVSAGYVTPLRRSPSTHRERPPLARRLLRLLLQEAGLALLQVDRNRRCAVRTAAHKARHSLGWGVGKGGGGGGSARQAAGTAACGKSEKGRVCAGRRWPQPTRGAESRQLIGERRTFGGARDGAVLMLIIPTYGCVCVASSEREVYRHPVESVAAVWRAIEARKHHGEFCDAVHGWLHEGRRKGRRVEARCGRRVI